MVKTPKNRIFKYKYKYIANKIQNLKICYNIIVYYGVLWHLSRTFYASLNNKQSHFIV